MPGQGQLAGLPASPLPRAQIASAGAVLAAKRVAAADAVYGETSWLVRLVCLPNGIRSLERWHAAVQINQPETPIAIDAWRAPDWCSLNLPVQHYSIPHLRPRQVSNTSSTVCECI